jgi:hypothetical protein
MNGDNFRMKSTMNRCFVLLVPILLFGLENKLGLSQDLPTVADVRLAYQKSTDAQRLLLPEFKTIFNWLTADSGQEKWRKIQWRHDLLQARAESAKLGKPLFIWAMNGDPLGCV